MGRATTPEVQDLAERIRAAQGPEIDQMTVWLEGEGEPMDSGTMVGMDHGSMEMDGLDQSEAMGELEAAENAEFDRRFLQLMIAHHVGAIEMAEAQLEDGMNSEMRALAESVVAAKEAEIALDGGVAPGTLAESSLRGGRREVDIPERNRFPWARVAR